MRLRLRVGAAALAALAVAAPFELAAQYNPQVEQLNFQGRLIGRDLYDRTGQKIGTIRDVLRVRSDQIEGVLVDIGSFLGLGERPVAVPASQIEWRDNVLHAVDLTRHQAESLPTYTR
jgi:hypothetical protein